MSARDGLSRSTVAALNAGEDTAPAGRTSISAHFFRRILAARFFANFPRAPARRRIAR